MKLVKSKPRYRCGFCRHTATEEAMKRHEKICWLNPNRLCSLCHNTGYMDVDVGYPYGSHQESCYYCKEEKKDLIEELLIRRKLGPEYLHPGIQKLL